MDRFDPFLTSRCCHKEFYRKKYRKNTQKFAGDILALPPLFIPYRTDLSVYDNPRFEIFN